MLVNKVKGRQVHAAIVLSVFILLILLLQYRLVARDIGGSDPERMAAPRAAEYCEQLFKGTSVKVGISW